VFYNYQPAVPAWVGGGGVIVAKLQEQVQNFYQVAEERSKTSKEKVKRKRPGKILPPE